MRYGTLQRSGDGAPGWASRHKVGDSVVRVGAGTAEPVRQGAAGRGRAWQGAVGSGSDRKRQWRMAATGSGAGLDDPDELFDLIDRDDHVIGTVRRGDAHRDRALVHRSVQVLVFNSAGQLLLQRRSRTKDLFPGYYCASASGHVARGDAYAATAEREVAEELGADLRLTYFGKTLVASAYETEMTALFLARGDGPFRFHPIETDGGEFLRLEEVDRARASGALPMTPALLAALDALHDATRTQTLDSLLATL